MRQVHKPWVKEHLILMHSLTWRDNSRENPSLAAAQVFKGQSSVKWAFAPLESLYDVEAIVSNWDALGTKVAPCSALTCAPPAWE